MESVLKKDEVESFFYDEISRKSFVTHKVKPFMRVDYTFRTSTI